MLVRKAYKFRAYPDAELVGVWTRAIGCVRLVYNLALSQREAFGRRGRRLDPMAELVELKREFPFLREDAFSQSLQQALRDLDKAYQNFFEGRAGYPQPRRKFENDSMRFPQPYIKNGLAIRAACHRPWPSIHRKRRTAPGVGHHQHIEGIGCRAIDASAASDDLQQLALANLPTDRLADRVGMDFSFSRYVLRAGQAMPPSPARRRFTAPVTAIELP